LKEEILKNVLAALFHAISMNGALLCFKEDFVFYILWSHNC